MSSFDLDIVDEKSQAGSDFMFRVSQELQRAFLSEKRSRKITQQGIADQLGTSRAVINRQLQGLENIGLRRVGELFWAMGWHPSFEAQKIPAEENSYPPVEIVTPPPPPSIKVSPPSTTDGTIIRPPLKLQSAA